MTPNPQQSKNKRNQKSKSNSGVRQNAQSNAVSARKNSAVLQANSRIARPLYDPRLTRDGVAWARVALDPSLNDKTVAVRLPDGSPFNTLSIPDAGEVIFTCPDGMTAGQKWQCDIVLAPIATCPVSFDASTIEGVSPGLYRKQTIFANGSSNALDAVRFLDKNFSAWRVLAQSVTVELIANSVSNQGTVIATQLGSAPFHLNPAQQLTAATELDENDEVVKVDVGLGEPSNTGAFNEVQLRPHVICYERSDDFVYARNMSRDSRRYTAEAKEGCFMVTKMFPESTKWQTEKDIVLYTATTQATKIEGEEFGWIMKEDDTPTPGFPLYGVNPTYVAARVLKPTYVTSPFQDTMGVIHFDGLSDQASLRIRWRQVIEAVPRLQTSDGTSTYATLASPSPLKDDLALGIYQKISAALPSAYPAAYNGAGEIWDKISSVIKEYAPIVGDIANMIIPGAGTVISGLAGGVTWVGDKIREATK